MIKKLIHIFCFNLLLILMISPVLLSGELTDVDRIIARQSNDKKQILFGTAYSASTMYYKLEFAKKKSAPVLALGTSRVMQIKKSFFEKPHSFYNAGGGVSHIDQFENFLESLDKSTPKILMIALDQYFFNESWSIKLPDQKSEQPTKNPADFKLVTNNIVRDYGLQKLKMKTLVTNSNCIGINAKVKNNGFLNDGSYFYGDIYQHPEKQPDYKFKDTLNRIENGNSRFEYAEKINPEAVYLLEEFLAYCKQNNIFVIGFTPPYAPTIVDEMEKYGDSYSYMWEIPDAVGGVFEKYAFEYYDYTDIRKLDCDDSYFIDGFHGGDVAYIRMLIDMIEAESKLSRYCDVDKLKELDSQRYSNLLVEMQTLS